MTVTRGELEHFFTELLRPQDYADDCPNGLQIEGKERVERVAFAVSATAESARAAVAGSADALVVHHGLYWQFHGARPLVGPFAKRVLPLVRSEINLFAYHLPLDGHLEIGNAAGIARALDLRALEPFGAREGMPTGVKGTLAAGLPARELKTRLEAILRHPVVFGSPGDEQIVRTIGIVTGGAHSGWTEAADQGLDAYLTGEIREHDWHEAREAGVHLYAGGHHATEVFGVRRLLEEVERRFAVRVFYIDSANPA